MALEKECQMIDVECSSHFTAKAVERLGFKCIYSLSYMDYVDDQGKVVFKSQPPHEHFKMYVFLLWTIVNQYYIQSTTLAFYF